MSIDYDTELRRMTIRRRVRIRRQVIESVPSPEARAELASRMRADGATDTEIEDAFRIREACYIAVCDAMDLHRRMEIVSGRLLVSGRDAETHQIRLERFNSPIDGAPSIAVETFKQINNGMEKHKQ
ncbi:hypothetical protein [Neorhodopirellula pilleata]|uniref:Uncharacterized protein n=1 Tax=Neorhodopirellula pilleata TaxID=2714738 RepID=A0A5C5ZKV1_9BACT|nr:hypothetical protein [Neorhodopirellula pilleata]TWT88009.1 hypothetical protein Pla100_57390 [Neorhodopirellula pilleata]